MVPLATVHTLARLGCPPTITDKLAAGGAAATPPPPAAPATGAVVTAVVAAGAAAPAGRVVDVDVSRVLTRVLMLVLVLPFVTPATGMEVTAVVAAPGTAVVSTLVAAPAMAVVAARPAVVSAVVAAPATAVFVAAVTRRVGCCTGDGCFCCSCYDRLGVDRRKGGEGQEDGEKVITYCGPHDDGSERGRYCERLVRLSQIMWRSISAFKKEICRHNFS